MPERKEDGEGTRDGDSHHQEAHDEQQAHDEQDDLHDEQEVHDEQDVHSEEERDHEEWETLEGLFDFLPELGRPRKGHDAQFVALFAAGCSAKEIAEITGTSESTVRRRRREPHIRRAWRERAAAQANATAEALHEQCAVAVAALAQRVTSTNDKVAISAANAILSHAARSLASLKQFEGDTERGAPAQPVTATSEWPCDTN